MGSLRALSVFAATMVSVALPSPASAIYGGEKVAKDDGAAVAKFTWYLGGRSGNCSGVLVGERAVLTAAHCVVSIRGQRQSVRRVRIGNPAGKTVTVAVTRTVVHPDYKPGETKGDVAILHLKKPVTDRSPIPLATVEQEPKAGSSPIQAYGFGVLNTRGTRRGFRTTRLFYLSPFACMHGPVKEMAKTRMCAADRTSGICPGDSGGPVYWDGGERRLLVGLISHALDRKRCQDTGAILIRLSGYRDWILAQLIAGP